jgi:hypothetical protein
MSDQVYAVTDLNGYISQMRIVAAESLSENSDNDNLDEYISLDQMVGIVKSKSLGTDEEDRYLLNESANEKIFEEVAVWIHNVGLAKLGAKDLIECAWDDELNEMIFWCKESNQNDKPKRKRKRKNL